MFLDLDLSQRKMIPDHAIARWDNLGIALDIESGVIAQIKQNFTPGDVVVNCRGMLTDWQLKSGKTDVLIGALKACKLNAVAAVVEKGYIN